MKGLTMKERILRFQKIIETTDWDNELIKNSPQIDHVCWIIAGFAIGFFAVMIVRIALR